MQTDPRTLFVALSLLIASLGLSACGQGTDEAPAGEAAGQEAAAPADDGALAADVLKDWDALKTIMMDVGDAMPAENFDFKPTDELRTFGEQLMHIAGANVRFMTWVDPNAVAPTLPEGTDKADVLQAVSDSFDFGSQVLGAQTNASIQEVVEDAGFLGPSTRARIAYRTMIHTWDEYGVMTVYLRVNDIVPPMSR